MTAAPDRAASLADRRTEPTIDTAIDPAITPRVSAPAPAPIVTARRHAILLDDTEAMQSKSAAEG